MGRVRRRIRSGAWDHVTRARAVPWGLCAASVMSAGCLERPLEPIDPRTTSTVTLGLGAAVDKIDLLLAIDDSASMADKQEILALAVPDLVERLANPRCVGGDGVPLAEQPASPAEVCPPGSDREFAPVLDIHIGIISSNLGGQGAASCAADADDLAHLKVLNESGEKVPTYEGLGFLAWDPRAEMDPPGESSVDDGNGGGLVPTLADLVEGVGQSGCGYEAQLESWYRFLVDPEPYATLDEDGLPRGTDKALLAQRADFLRPDSLLAILMLTDENDCSAVASSDTKKVLDGGYVLAAPRSECATNPADPCCLPCGTPLEGTGCAEDPACYVDGELRVLSGGEDHYNLRCFDQKRRFGVDVLQPVSRYVDALRAPTVPNRKGDAVPNPLFVAGADGRNRTAQQVFFAGVVGVPWQDIARNPASLADGFKTVLELETADPVSGLSGWDIVLGDPANGIPPADPLMIESIDPRSGTHPITGEAIAPPDAPKGANVIHGHEHLTPDGDDLQYACTFDLLDERHCTTPNDPACDCSLKPGATPEDKKSSICQAEDDSYSTTQYQARAYPGRRQLEVLRGLGEQGIVGSVCPAYMGEDGDRADFGYRPAIGAIVDRLKDVLGGQCLPRSLTPDAQGQVACVVIEARADDSCSCDGVRSNVSAEHAGAVTQIEETGLAADQGWNCFCELPQLAGEALDVCREDLDKNPVLDGASIDGWCYVDATTSPPIGNPELVDKCSANEKRQVRTVGEAKAIPGSVQFVTCNAESF